MKVRELVRQLLTLDQEADVVGISDHSASEGCEYNITGLESYVMVWYRVHLPWMAKEPVLCKETNNPTHEEVSLPRVPVVALKGGDFL